jgi:hypothetical protein
MQRGEGPCHSPLLPSGAHLKCQIHAKNCEGFIAGIHQSYGRPGPSPFAARRECWHRGSAYGAFESALDVLENTPRIALVIFGFAI